MKEFTGALFHGVLSPGNACDTSLKISKHRPSGNHLQMTLARYSPKNRGLIVSTSVEVL